MDFQQNEPIRPWRYPVKGLAWRIFLTCWLIYSIHLTTNTVREIYLALAIGDHLSFRVDDYARMHPDLFEKPGYGWHIGANPGGSMIAAIPYAICRPITDRIVARVNQSRTGQQPPAYDSPWPMARAFYQEAWRRGFDIKFGLASIVMQTLCMGPLSAGGVVAMFFLLRQLFRSDKTACWLALLYGFGTPVFYRAGYINHNMLLGHFALLGFIVMWNPGQTARWPARTRSFLGGLAGGTAVLLDYSGVPVLLVLFGYSMLRSLRNGGAWNEALAHGIRYFAGTLGPVFLLWFYQWASFGHPFYPGQHWMPPVAWIESGYQGMTGPQWELLSSLLFDYRYGLFVTCPLFLLALASPWMNRNSRRVLPSLELGTLLGVAVALWLFCGGISYTRLQFNSGLRYLAPLLPFLFVPAAVTLVRLPAQWRYYLTAGSIALAWCMAMYRDVERGLGVLETVLQIFAGGPQLPLMVVLSRMGGTYGNYFSRGANPAPIFLLAAVILYGVWWVGKPSPGRNEEQTT